MDSGSAHLPNLLDSGSTCLTTWIQNPPTWCRRSVKEEAGGREREKVAAGHAGEGESRWRRVTQGSVRGDAGRRRHLGDVE